MAQYKVPQDVEADDKLLGPFSFRQFVYLMIAGALIALAVALFQLFPLLAVIPFPFILFFGAMALPLKKDQPMETYLAAVASYYLKPHNRKWIPGQKEVSIQISAPKKDDSDERIRSITGEEATHRLSFLADIVDTEGQAIKGVVSSHANMELAAEANQTQDMFETDNYGNIANAIQRDENERHAEVIQGMRAEIARAESTEIYSGNTTPPTRTPAVSNQANQLKPDFSSQAVVQSNAIINQESTEQPKHVATETIQKNEAESPNPSIMNLVNNSEYTVATIAKEANRIKQKEKGEVYISIH